VDLGRNFLEKSFLPIPLFKNFQNFGVLIAVALDFFSEKIPHCRFGIEKGLNLRHTVQIGDEDYCGREQKTG
jgi:hypothetical protein